VRIATDPVTNMGEAADVVVALNEQVLYSRIDVGALRRGTIVFLESCWAEDPDEGVRTSYREALADFDARGYVVVEVPMERECRELVPDPAVRTCGRSASCAPSTSAISTASASRSSASSRARAPRSSR
jgi:hypothetical protein